MKASGEVLVEGTQGMSSDSVQCVCFWIILRAAVFPALGPTSMIFCTSLRLYSPQPLVIVMMTEGAPGTLTGRSLG